MDDVERSKLFFSKLQRCWSTAGQSLFNDSDITRFKSSSFSKAGEISFWSRIPREPRLALASDPVGLGGRRENRRFLGAGISSLSWEDEEESLFSITGSRLHVVPSTKTYCDLMMLTKFPCVAPLDLWREKYKFWRPRSA